MWYDFFGVNPMSVRTFNDFMDEYIQTHPSPSDEEFAMFFKQNTDRVEVEDLFTDVHDNILVSKHHPYANTHVNQHTHGYFELIYVSRGRCLQKINGMERDLEEGDLCLLSLKDFHSVKSSSDDDLIFNIMIRKELFSQSFLYMISGEDLFCQFFLNALFSRKSESSFLYFPYEQNTSISDLTEKLIMEFYMGKPGYQKAVECWLALLFTELARTYRELPKAEENRKINEILMYISENKLNVTLSKTAEHFHYHPSYLSGLIRSETGMSFSEIVIQSRLSEASAYLRNTNRPIDEIMDLCGFHDRSYFNRTFRKHYQMTPSAYRASVMH